MTGDSEPFKLRVTVRPRQKDGAVLRGVLCEVRLPTRATDSVELRLSSSQFRRHGFPFEFSLQGQIRKGDRVQRTVHATRVYSKDAGTRFWGQGLAEDVVLGEPVDLTITDRFTGRERAGPKAPVHIAFWLTDNIHLRSRKGFTTSYTGRVTVRVHRRQRLTVKGVRLTFDDYARHIAAEDGGRLTFREPVATGSVRRLEDVTGFVSSLEDVLMLAGLAARQRTACVGWEAGSRSVALKHYRRDVSIPPAKSNHSFNEALIAPEEFPRFLRQAYRVFRAAPEQELLRRAIQGIIYDDGHQTLEASFLRLFSAVESLTLRYQRMHEMEFAVPTADFKPVAKAIKQAIKTNVAEKHRRKMLLEKIRELNRPSFSAVVQGFCEAHQVDLSDLWPLTAERPVVSLYWIRNRFAHGEAIGRDESGPLAVASLHLRWTVERLALAALSWPIDRTGVHFGIGESVPDGSVPVARSLLEERWSREMRQEEKSEVRGHGEGCG